MITLRGAMEKLRWVKKSWSVGTLGLTPYMTGDWPYSMGVETYGAECHGACAEGIIEMVLGAERHEDRLECTIEDFRADSKSSADLTEDECLLVLDRYILEAGRHMAETVWRAWINDSRNAHGRCMQCSLDIKNKLLSKYALIPISRKDCIRCESWDSIPTWNDASGTEESHVEELFDVLEQFPLWRDLMATRNLNEHQRRAIAIGFVLTPTVTSDIREGLLERTSDHPTNVLVAANVI